MDRRYLEPTWHGKPIPFKRPTREQVEAANREKARQKTALSQARARVESKGAR